MLCILMAPNNSPWADNGIKNWFVALHTALKNASMLVISVENAVFIQRLKTWQVLRAISCLVQQVRKRRKVAKTFIVEGEKRSAQPWKVPDFIRTCKPVNPGLEAAHKKVRQNRMFRAGSSTPKPVALLEILHTLLSNRRSVFIMHHLSPPLYITP